MNHGATDVVVVEIFGRQYPIRSDLDQAYVAQLAQYVDQKMYASAEQTPGDMVRIAVLAALNIADEHFKALMAHSARSDDAQRLTSDLEQLVDDALARSAPPA